MTVRNESFGTIPYGPGGFTRFSSGLDGKYEVTADGVHRLKWNNYSCTIKRGTQSKSLISGSQQYYFAISNTPPSPFDVNDVNKGLSKLSERIKGHDFNLAVNSAQIGQTTTLVITTLRSFRDAFRHLRRGDIVKACRSLGTNSRKSKFRSKTISGRWLELQYGWLPLCSDVYEASKAIEAANAVRTKTFSASLHKGKPFNSSQSAYQYDAIGRAQGAMRWTHELLEVPSAARNLGLLDPATVAWEVLPYSFVIDWFIPIGTYIENLSYIPNLSGRSMVSRKVSFQASKPVMKFPIPPDWRMGNATFECVWSDRVVGGLVVPRPKFNSFDLAFNGRRIYNAIALTHLAFKR